VDQQPVEVWWGWQTAQEQVEIKEIFNSVGIETEPRVVTNPSGGEPGIIVDIVVGGALVSFFHGYFEAAGQDAWEKTRQLVEKTQTWFTERCQLEPPWDGHAGLSREARTNRALSRFDSARGGLPRARRDAITQRAQLPLEP
jgi:hypothetical protein